MLAWLSLDGRKLLVTRVLRTFAYGYLAVVLGVYLDQLGMTPVQVGLIFSAAIGGSALMTIFWSLVADRYGRRKTVATMALLMAVGGLLFAIIAHKTHVNLQLADGAILADPEGLIEGTGKRIRHVKIRSVEEAGAPWVRAIVAAQLALRGAPTGPA